ncbi:helix-turn-helix transcriptional regulator [Myxococcus stipitatus]|uniref:helix-turn-helix transcriptional regulator n=1 Tax=Myxococcus stipitatus TaxID=83455 RepID=UPI001F40F904|nr:helix-turn-helix transcriptional regulator [Myxococcus stipitatus]MCE9669693.1 helix-turn-helix transcriptional regulator [Myxococcus stipitatus]
MNQDWEPPCPLRPLVTTPELLVGEWACAGGHAAARWREQARYHELDLLQTGSHLRTHGRQRSVVDPTTAAVNTPGNEYWMEAASQRPQRGTLLLLRGALAEECASREAPRTRHVSASAARLHFQLLRALDPLAREETALALVHHLHAEGRAPPRGPRAISPAWRQLTEELQHVMATSFTERLTVSALAAATRTSPFHASRVFRAVTGETMHAHLNRLRLRAALFELEHASGRLTDVALEMGFSSHSHFTHAFRREFGCPPSALATPRP